MLAIAAPSFDPPSTTFIRNHVKTIAPGRTALICKDPAGAADLADAVLSDVPSLSVPRSLREQVRHSFEWRWQEYVDPGLRPADRRRVAAFLREHGVTTLLVEFANYGALFPRACKEAGVRLFVHAHGYDVTQEAQNPKWARFYRGLFRAADGMIAPSQFIADRMYDLGCPRAKLHVSPCGVDPALFRPSSREPGRILAIGRLVEKKAPHLTIRAFAAIAARFPEARLDMVGAGPLEAECRAAIDAAGLGDRVVMHGAQPADVVAGLMARAAIFAQHSVTAASGDMEGLPVAILEAMASAVPVVSTRHSGIPEAVSHGETGFLVEEGDVEGMARAMAALLADRGKAAAMGDAGRARFLSAYTATHTRDLLRAAMGIAG